MNSIDHEIAAHDAALSARGFEIWIGAEPTFTRKDAQEPWWLWQAEGGDKEHKARELLAALASRHGGAPQRIAGRHFEGEPKPRFAWAWAWRGSLLTVTPDPGVVEVNMAPAADATAFLAQARAVYESAAAAGLAPLRWRWNGDEVDSGGGGQITFGGPSPEKSPFFLHPAMLTGLLRYLNRHPSLSYKFATECVGSAGQGPRPDEGVRERFDELGVTLDRLAARGHDVTPALLWSTLAPLLVDGSGNSHRAELNVEKLWAPHPPERGRLGLVEARALRMQPTPERMVAVGALLRAVAARVAASLYVEPLIDWGAELHDRWALPCFLADDLAEVLTDLEAHGFGLGPTLCGLLTSGPEERARLEVDGASLTITPALEFWPLVGDVASQERSGARVVDSSTARVQILVVGVGSVSACGREVPLRDAGNGRQVGAVRWRTFVPSPGFHPGLEALDPLTVSWRGRTISLHGWKPTGGGYAALPADATEAATRRRERIVIHEGAPAEVSPTPGRTILDLRTQGGTHVGQGSL